MRNRPKPHFGIATRLWRSSLLLCCWLLAFTAQAQVNTVDLSNQQARSFVLPAANFTNAFEFTLPANVTRFRLTLTGNVSPAANDADTDLFLRFGQPFPRPVNDYGAPARSEDLFEYAHYYSISGELNEVINVSTASTYPAQAGKWYVSVLNFSNSASYNGTIKLDLFTSASGAAPISVRFDLACAPGDISCECDLAPWNDPSTTGFTAPGNSGSTLGQKRRLALLEAVRQISTQLRSDAPISIQACWNSVQPETSGSVTLASAGPTSVLINDRSFARVVNNQVSLTPSAAFLPKNNTFYVAAAATKNNGNSSCQTFGGSCTDTVDIQVNFNVLVDGPDALGATSFYYGFQTQTNTNNIDFISIALHELTHGLGYVSFVDIGDETQAATGSELAGRDDIFSRQLVATGNGTPRNFAQLTDSERVAAASSTALQWIGKRGLASPGLALLPGEFGIPMFAPSPIRPGSNVSHLADGRFNSQLMLPNYSSTRTLGIAAGQLEDVGWDPTAKSAPIKARVYAGNWFDPARSGHGFDIEPAGSVNGYNRVLVTAYTYDQNAEPEYFLAVGPMVDGVFSPEATSFGNSLVRYKYVNNRPVIDDATQGFLRIDFNDGENSSACTENGRITPGASANGSVNAGQLTLIASGQKVNWCIQPLITQAQRPSLDFTGHWYDPSDPGWGVGIAQAIGADGKNVTLAVLYYPDALGNPRWAFAQSNDFRGSETIPIKHRRGFCRTCQFGTEDIDAGSMNLLLGDVNGLPNQNNRITFSVTFKGAAGGTFTRTNANLVRLVPRPAEIE